MIFDGLDGDGSNSLTKEEAVADLRRMDTKIQDKLVRQLGEGHVNSLLKGKQKVNHGQHGHGVRRLSAW